MKLVAALFSVAIVANVHHVLSLGLSTTTSSLTSSVASTTSSLTNSLSATAKDVTVTLTGATEIANGKTKTYAAAIVDPAGLASTWKAVCSDGTVLASGAVASATITFDLKCINGKINGSVGSANSPNNVFVQLNAGISSNVLACKCTDDGSSGSNGGTQSQTTTSLATSVVSSTTSALSTATKDVAVTLTGATEIANGTTKTYAAAIVGVASTWKAVCSDGTVLASGVVASATITFDLKCLNGKISGSAGTTDSPNNVFVQLDAGISSNLLACKCIDDGSSGSNGGTQSVTSSLASSVSSTTSSLSSSLSAIVDDATVTLTGATEIANGATKTYAAAILDPAGLASTWKAVCSDGTVLASGVVASATITFDLKCLDGKINGSAGSADSPNNVFVQLDAGISSNVLACKCTDGSPGSKGDPHFKTWSGKKFDFHGQCDLVLLSHPEFHSGLGLDVHLRTKIDNKFSHIASAAVRIGNDILEISGDHQLDTPCLINGELTTSTELETGVAHLAGYQLVYFNTEKDSRHFTIDLGNGENIAIKTYGRFIEVKMSNKGKSGSAFDGSLGMMGLYETGQMTARDGVTIVNDPVLFGFEWQVRDFEAHLFHKWEGPQYPALCQMPSVSATSRRQLRDGETYISQEVAYAACAHVDELDREECIFDVLATNNIDLAGAY